MSGTFFPNLHRDNHRPALWDGDKAMSYGELDGRVNRLAAGLLGERSDLAEERIAFFIPASLDYVTVILAIWRAGGIAVPLNVACAASELDHYLRCAGVSRLILSRNLADTTLPFDALQEVCAPLGTTLLRVDDLMIADAAQMPALAPHRRAMIIFTSGTTNKPKGVVSTHGTVRAQIETLVDAWAWTENDVIPLFLPLHHIHGIINVLACALWAGATVDLYPRMDLDTLAQRISAGRYTLFMAVPTIYVKLVQHIGRLVADEGQRVCAGFAAMRLNVSGSAACPVPLFEQWRALTGQVLLERYGMTEIGMALSNPYDGERRAGYVGQPLPGVHVQLMDEDGRVIEDEGVPGEIAVKGPNVFLEYWGNAAATQESRKEGWFCTGDMAVMEQGSYRIMGRSSVDIIKSGGYKLSALEIESVLLTHPAIAEVALIGLPDNTWGEAVIAVAALNAGQSLDYAALKAWCRDTLSAYKIPKQLEIVDALPRNAMGKVTKPELKRQLTPPAP